MHGTDNIDNCGSFSTDGMGTAYTPHGEDGVNDCADGTEDGVDEDETSKNVGDLSVGNAEPVSFNHMTGNFTEALVGTDAGGSDQTASWGGTPVVRPAVDDTNNAMADRDELLDSGRHGCGNGWWWPLGRKGRRWYGG